MADEQTQDLVEVARRTVSRMPDVATIRAMRAEATRKLGYGVISGVAASPFVYLAISQLATGTVVLATQFVAAALGTLSYVHLRGARSLERKASADERTVVTAAIRKMATEANGRLRAEDVAQQLQISEPEADAHLTSLLDGDRVDVEVNDDGDLEYVFRLD